MQQIKDIYNKVSYIFTKKQKYQLVGMISILLLEAILELIGITSIYPFIAVILNQDMIQSNRFLSAM